MPSDFFSASPGDEMGEQRRDGPRPRRPVTQPRRAGRRDHRKALSSRRVAVAVKHAVGVLDGHRRAERPAISETSGAGILLPRDQLPEGNPRHASEAEDVASLLQQRVGIERLGHVEIGADFLPALSIELLPLGREQDDVDVRQAEALLGALQTSKPLSFGIITSRNTRFGCTDSIVGQRLLAVEAVRSSTPSSSSSSSV